MPLVLIATAGAADANSYATVAEADLYHEGRLHASDWTSATLEKKEAALVWATQSLESTIRWDSWQTTLTQALQWPRYGMLKRSLYDWVPDNVIPQELKNATAELARHHIANDPAAAVASAETANIKRLKTGPVEIEYKDDVVAVVAQTIPDAVWTLIPYWWRVGAASNVRRLVRT